MKIILIRLSVSLFNKLSSLLRYGRSLNLKREEIQFVRTHFSQFGEDLAVQRWAKKLKIENGCYLDVGAFHPIYISNTFLLHRDGWSGVNVDMNPDKIEEFKRLRPGDDNICRAISAKKKQYVISDKGTPSECLKELTTDDVTDSSKQVIIESSPLAEVLSYTSLANRRIDYLNVDCEGHDLEVIQQLDFEIYDPQIITIEALDAESQNQIRSFLDKKGYVLCEKIHATLLFVRDTAPSDIPSIAIEK